MTIAIVSISLILLSLGWGYRSKKNLWNEGICAEYNEPWVHFDNDSQGGRGYMCRDRYIWISSPVDSTRLAVNRTRS